MPRQDIIITCEKNNDDGVISLCSLAQYIVDYIAEEVKRDNVDKNFDAIDQDLILNAVDAYQGGAR